MTAIPAYDNCARLINSGDSITGGAGAGMGFVVTCRYNNASNFSTASWGGKAMTNIHNDGSIWNLKVWMITGDVQGSQAITWTGTHAFDHCLATTLTKASKLSGSWVDGAASYSSLEIDIPCTYRTLAIGWFAANAAVTIYATETGNSLRYGTTTMGMITDADTAATNALTAQGGFGTYLWGATGIAIDSPAGGNQVIFF